jgi:HEAT repeat protein
MVVSSPIAEILPDLHPHHSLETMKTILLSTLSILALVLLAWQFLPDTDEPADQPAPEPDESTPPVTEPAEPPFSERFAHLADPRINPDDRVEELRQLDARTLSEADVNSLYAYLTDRAGAPRNEEWWLVLNEIMEQIRLQAIAPELIVPTFLSILLDPNEAEVPRDYALQHLAQWITPNPQGLDIPHEQDLRLIRDALAGIIRVIPEPGLGRTTIPGTGLIMLNLMQNAPFADQLLRSALGNLGSWIKRTVLGQNPDASDVLRGEAIQTVADFLLDEHAHYLRELAHDPRQSPDLRLRAIAALGDLGHPADRTPLLNLANSPGPLREAVISAIGRLDRRNP